MLHELRHRLVARRTAPASAETISLTRAGVPRLGRADWSCGCSGPASIIWATTNAVNVTDGLDGLAGGSALMGFGAFTIIAYWAFRNPRRLRRGRQPARPGRARGRRSPARASASCGATRPRRGSSWATSARSASARRWRCWRSTIEHPAAARADLRHQRDGGRFGRASRWACSRRRGRKKRLFRMSPIHHHFELSAGPRPP